MAPMDILEGDAFRNIPYKPALLSGSNFFSLCDVRADGSRNRSLRP